MKRQKKFGKMKMPAFLEDAKSILLQKMISIAVLLVFLLVFFVVIKAFLYRSDYFRLKSVETKCVLLDQKTTLSISNQLLNIYGLRNVFSIDLKNIEDSIWASYPDAKDIVVKLALPDKLSVSIKFRKPVAIIKDTKLYPVDEEGVLIPSVDASLLKNMAIVEGIDIGYEEKRLKKVNSKNLQTAIELLKAINQSRFMVKYGPLSVNASDIKNMSLYLPGGVEARMGCENFRERLQVLDRTLKDPRLIMDKIKYIDVRFKDVIIGPK